MIGIVLIFIVAGLMKSIAETSGESGMMWAVVSFFISVVLMFVIGSFFAAPASLVVTYLILVVKSMKSA